MPAAPRIVLIAAAIGTAASSALLWLTDLPLGVPGEWTWLRIPFSIEHWWGWITAGFAAALYLGLVAFGSRNMESRGRAGRVACSLILFAAGFGWLIVVQSAVPGGAGLSKSSVVLFNRGSSGYFSQARYEVNDTRAFLAGYEDLVAQGDYLHIGTHPPGLTLVFRGLLSVFESSPALTDLVLATEPDGVRDTAATIRRRTIATGHTFHRSDEAVLWCATLLANAAAAATVIPLFLMLAQFVDRRTAWFAAALWPLVPGVAVFLPKSDAVFPLISILGPCLWLTGWRTRSIVCCALSGLTLFGGMLLSLAIAPIAVLTGLTTVIGELRGRHEVPRAPPSPPSEAPISQPASLGEEGRGEGSESPCMIHGELSKRPPSPSSGLRPPSPHSATEARQGTHIVGRRARSTLSNIHAPSFRATSRWWLTSITAAAIGFFVPVLLLWGRYDINLPGVWSHNVTNHAAFYDHFTRTWWKWLLVNPLEASLAAGAPLAIAALIGAIRSRGDRLFPLIVATAIVWGLLWISGKNSGEAARLWLLFQPWLAIAATGALVDQRAAGLGPAERPASPTPAARERAIWLALLALQALACIATVTRIDGFDLSGP